MGGIIRPSLAIGADYIATGHYARIEQLPNGRYAIKNSVTAEKDQTYALYNLTQTQLSRTLMPVGDYHKDEIRQIAEEIGLMVAHKKDSMEICFIPDDDYADLLIKSVEILYHHLEILYPKMGKYLADIKESHITR